MPNNNGAPTKFVFLGRVVTMDANSTVVADGAIYVDSGTITAVQDRKAAPPTGFETAPQIQSGGVIYPGLIELHNHLSYDSLPMWNVPQIFLDRGVWQNNTEYIANVSGPMGVIAKSTDKNVLAAVARYAETKCLLGGVTTGQGIALKGDNLDTYYHSAMRVVDDPGDKNFPRAATRIPDLDASDWAKFNAEVHKASCLLLHLSEGFDPAAHEAFTALQHGNTWAISPALAGIHCAALNAADFAVMKQNGGSVVWSPLSNLLLYGQTTDIKAARSAGLDVALGSDWSPSGSKNLLNELKVAKVVGEVKGIGLADKDIVAMATSTAARIVKWDKLVGSIEAGKRADLIAIKTSHPTQDYTNLINAKETDIDLLMVNGTPIVGTTQLMADFGMSGENIKVGNATRTIHYGAGDPRVTNLTFAQAQAAMKDALSRVPTLLADEAKGHRVPGPDVKAMHTPRLQLALDEQHLGHFALRPRLPLNGQVTGPDAVADAKEVVPPKAQDLDPVSVADDAKYADLLQTQKNIPTDVKAGLKNYY